MRHSGDTGQTAREFDAFYAATAARMLHAVYAMTGDRSEAQDCVQEAYARAWQRWGTVGGYGDPEAWVRTVARRIAVSRWRKARNGVTAWRRHGRAPDADPPGIEHVVLVAALRKLPEAQRHALVLHHLVGLSVAEIADETGSPTGTVKARLSRGRAALAAILDDPSGDASNDLEVRRAR